MPKKSSKKSKFYSWIERENLENSPNYGQYKHAFNELKEDVNNIYWLFKIFLGYEENNVRKNIYVRTKRLIKHNKTSNLTLYSYLLKFGKENGRIKFEEYKNKQAYSNSFEYKKQKKGWTKERFDEYNKSRSSSLKNMMKRYGTEEGRIKFDEYRNIQAYTNSKEYLGEEKYISINKKKANSLENYIRKYGEIEGIERYKEFWENLFQGDSSRVSKISQELFNSLDLPNPDKTYFASKNKEFNVWCNLENQKLFFYDFVDSLNKKVIEYNGDYWHKNPEIYEDNVENNKIWKRDYIKNKFIQDLGYDILIIWDSDYRKDKEKIKEKCNEFIRG